MSDYSQNEYYHAMYHHMYQLYIKHAMNCRKNRCPMMFCGPVNANCYPLYGLPEPTRPCEAVTKQYVDRKCNGNSVIIRQSKTEAQKVTMITYEQVGQVLSVIMTLTKLDNLHNRLISFYTQNITSTSFEIVTNMEANLDRFIGNMPPNTYINKVIATLVTMNGNPAGLFTDINGFQQSPGPVLVTANDSIGKTDMIEVIPTVDPDDNTGITSPLGKVLGIIQGNPASIYLKEDGTLIFTRAENPDGRGIWTTHTIGNFPIIQIISNPIELNGGVYALIYTGSYIYSLISQASDNYDIWHNNRVTELPSLQLNKLNPAAIGSIPSFSIAEPRSSELRPINLVYYFATDSLGNSWFSEIVESFSEIRSPIVTLMINNSPCIAHQGVIFTGPPGSPVIGPGIYFHRLINLNEWRRYTVLDNRLGVSFELAPVISMDIIDGHPAITSSVSPVIQPDFESRIFFARANNVSGTLWSSQTIALTGTTLNTCFNNPLLCSLASISNNPAIIYSTCTSSGIVQFRYLRAGNTDQFVEDAEYQANWT